MIVTSTTESVPYTPPWLDAAAAVTFQLRAGSVIERGQMEAELSGPYLAGRVYGFELLAAIRSGLMALLAEDPDLDKLIELFSDEAVAEGTVADSDKALITETRRILGEHWPEYRNLLAQLERRREIGPIVALRRFCIDIVGRGVTFERGRDGLVAEATLKALDPMCLAAAGNRAFELQFPPTDTAGNSSPPQPSASGPATSSSDEKSKAVGKSRARRGPRTRASPARHGPSQ